MPPETKPESVAAANPIVLPAVSAEGNLHPEPPNAFAAKARDLDALRSAVIDAATVGAGLWLSYLFVLFYLAIAVGSVSHRTLFFESPVKLPFLNVDLPLVGFYVLGPGLFLVVHAYVLLHFVLLADKVGAFHAELVDQIEDEDARTRLRRQLPSNIFVQFLAGPREVRTGIMGFLLRLIAQISLVAGPLALLTLFHLQFLPYHDQAIAWWQRLAVIIDLGLLWSLWPSIARGETCRIGWSDFRRAKVVSAGLASIVPILLVFFIATFPGEWLHSNLPSVRFVPVYVPPSQWTSSSWARVSLHDLLVGGKVDLVLRKPTSPWSNRLVLPGVEVADPTAAKTGVMDSVSLRGRQLEGAVLFDARLRNMDFTASRLEGAFLDRADLRGAKFVCGGERDPNGQDSSASSHDMDPKNCAQLQGTTLYEAQLQGADLTGAQLQGAILNSAQLQDAALAGAQLWGASLRGSDLHGTKLTGANLQGALFDYAHLGGATLDETTGQGASFIGAHLQAARLVGAMLQGSVFQSAELQGATLDYAGLQGADFSGAKLRGASFVEARLQGAFLYGTDLRGATLRDTQLQGANFRDANTDGAWLLRTQLQGAIELWKTHFAGATLDHVSVWRAQPSISAKYARVIEPETGPLQLGEECRKGAHTGVGQLPPCDWTTASFEKLKLLMTEKIPAGKRRDEALRQISELDPAKPVDGEEAAAKAWHDLAEAPPIIEAHEERLSGVLLEIGCTNDIFLLHVLSSDLGQRFDTNSRWPAQVAAALLDEERCPGAGRLAEEDKVSLRALRDRRTSQQ